MQEELECPIFNCKLSVCWNGLHDISHLWPKLSTKSAVHATSPCWYFGEENWGHLVGWRGEERGIGKWSAEWRQRLHGSGDSGLEKVWERWDSQLPRFIKRGLDFLMYLLVVHYWESEPILLKYFMTNWPQQTGGLRGYESIMNLAVTASFPFFPHQQNLYDTGVDNIPSQKMTFSASRMWPSVQVLANVSSSYRKKLMRKALIKGTEMWEVTCPNF